MINDVMMLGDDALCELEEGGGGVIEGSAYENEKIIFEWNDGAAGERSNRMMVTLTLCVSAG